MHNLDQFTLHKQIIEWNLEKNFCKLHDKISYKYFPVSGMAENQYSCWRARTTPLMKTSTNFMYEWMCTYYMVTYKVYTLIINYTYIANANKFNKLKRVYICIHVTYVHACYDVTHLRVQNSISHTSNHGTLFCMQTKKNCKIIKNNYTTSQDGCQLLTI